MSKAFLSYVSMVYCVQLKVLYIYIYIYIYILDGVLLFIVLYISSLKKKFLMIYNNNNIPLNYLDLRLIIFSTN